MFKNLTLWLIVGSLMIGVQIAGAQEQNQQPSPPITGGGQAIERAGVTQGASAARNLVSENNLEEYAAACEKERLAADKFTRFKGAVLEDQGKIRALGFDRTTQQFEEMKANAEKNRKEFFLDIAHSVLGNISNYTRRTELSMSRTEASAWKNIFANRAPKGEQAIDSAIDDANRSKSDIVYFGQSRMHEISESVDKVWDHYNLTYDPDTIKRAVTLAQILGFGGPYGVLLDPATDLAELAYDEHEANKLTQLTEDQLKQLKALSNQMKSDADALAQSRSELKLAESVFSGGSCDSTKLVKRERQTSQNTPKTNAAVSPKPPKPSGQAVAKSHTGMIVGGVLAGVGAAGAAAAYGLRQQSQSSQNCTAPQQCGAFGPGDPPGCLQGQAFVNALAQYCSCRNLPSGSSLGSSGIVCP